MTLRQVLAVGSVLVLRPDSAAEAVGGGVPPVALSVSPARMALVAPASRTIEVRNVGSERAVVAVAPRSLDRLAATKDWLRVRPKRFVAPARSRTAVTLRVGANGLASPGDHRLLVLVVARPLSRTRLAVRVRLGVGIRVRVPGRIVRRLAVHGLRVRHHGEARDLLVSVANRGNVTEQLGGRVTVTLVRSGRLVSRLRLGGPRELFPGARTVFAMRYTGRIRGVVTAVVRVRFDGRLRPVARRYRLRL
jgi:hypothetical protein